MQHRKSCQKAKFYTEHKAHAIKKLLPSFLIILISGCASTTNCQIEEKVNLYTKRHYTSGYNHGEENFDCPNKIFHLDSVKNISNVIAQLQKIHGPITIKLPPGRHTLKEKLVITNGNICIDGSGPTGTELFFDFSLSEINPKTSYTSDNQATTPYSWSGGVISFKGEITKNKILTVKDYSESGSDIIYTDLQKPQKYTGKDILIRLTDDDKKTLLHQIYNNSPGNIEKINSITVEIPAKIIYHGDNYIIINKPLPIKITKEWNPIILEFESTVSNVAIKNIGISFEKSKYKGHFQEIGKNALEFKDTPNCWAQNLRIKNAENGIFIESNNCSINNVQILSENDPDQKYSAKGHHGIYIKGNYNVVSNLVFATKYIHDVSISKSHGNVIKNITGISLSLDHHRLYPFSNMFSNIDTGDGKRVLMSGGGVGRGKNSGANNIYWNVKHINQKTKPDFGAEMSIFYPGSIENDKHTNKYPDIHKKTLECSN